MNGTAGRAADDAGQGKAAPAADPAFVFRWFLAALGVYSGATLVFLYVEPLAVALLGPNPCCRGEAPDAVRIAALSWLGLCALAAVIARGLLLRSLLPAEGWRGAALGALKGAWLLPVFGMMIFLAVLQMDRFGLGFLLTIALVAIVVAALQAQATRVGPSHGGARGLWRHGLLAVENIYLFLLSLSGVFTVMLACSNLGGLHELALACP